MNKKIIILMMLLSQMALKAFQFIDSSVPKAGTFLLKRTIELITGLEGTGTDIMAKTYTPSLAVIQDAMKRHNSFVCLHLIYTPEYDEFLKKNNIKLVFIIRDPRDQLISQVFFMFKYSPNHGRFTFDNLLTALIGNNEKSPEHIHYPFQDQKLDTLSSMEYISHIKRFYDGFIGWQQSPQCYAVKFENLVGPKGGGTVELQRQEVANIAKHIGVKLNENQVANIASKIFGSTWSFREGKIGSWKKHFKPHHIESFKEVAGDLLTKLDYDENW